MNGTRRRHALLALMVLVAVLLPWLGEVYYPWPYQQVFLSAATRYRLSPYLLAAVARSESRFDPGATSRRGAVGMMQVMPATGRYVAHSGSLQATRALRSPDVSVDIAARYLRQLFLEFSSASGALAAYNGGEANVHRWILTGTWRPGEPLSRIPYPETRDFVARVERTSRWYAYLYPGHDRPEDSLSAR